MRTKLSLMVVMFAAFFLGQSAVADEDPIRTMANIMMHLEHYPSDSEKKTLETISSSNSVSSNVKTLASAMANLQHKVSSGDKPKLEAIVADAKASGNEKELAEIILHLNHEPSSSDKETLNKMLK